MQKDVEKFEVWASKYNFCCIRNAKDGYVYQETQSAWIAFKDQQEKIKKLMECLASISNGCIGELAMGYKLDANSIGEEIYAATGLTNTQLNEAVK